MRRVLLASIAAVVASCSIGIHGAAAASTASTASALPVVELLTTSASVPTPELEAALPAFQTAVSQDLAPAWGTDATLIVGDAAHPLPAAMTLVVSGYPDCIGCGGYHWRTAKRQPYGKVFYFDDESWQLILTHELFEMIVDPQANRFARWHGRTWLVEVADPCESGLYAYFIDGVAISDFITPAWYDAASTGPYDFTNSFSRPGQIGRHGYASYLKADGRFGAVFG